METARSRDRDESPSLSTADGLRYAVVHNIPVSYRSRDLRAFFSEFVESCRFDCFHFKHRPELKARSSKNVVEIGGKIEKESAESAEPGSSTEKPSQHSKTCCCIIRLTGSNRSQFVEKYSGVRWTNEKGDQHPFAKCFIAPIKLTDWTTPKGQSGTPVELTPIGNIMPQGNVGTPTKFLRGLINACRMPPSVIGRLGLNNSAPSRVGRGLYSQVPPPPAPSGGRNGGSSSYSRVPTPRARPLGGAPGGAKPARLDGDELLEERIAARQRGVDPDDAPDLDDDRCQEFERHEAQYDDVTEQDRIKERLYEEEMEIVWEKGGSGLVFYTDAFHWDQQKGTDTDERWADDWDVDTRVHYGGQAGEADKDARDMASIRREEAYKTGRAQESVFRKKRAKDDSSRFRVKLRDQEEEDSTDFAGFERHTKGFGSEVMRRKGWHEGRGLGAAEAPGLLEPVAIQITADSQKPRSKRGLGYRGEKLQRIGLKKQPIKHAITTIYDDHVIQDQQADDVIRRDELTRNKTVTVQKQSF